MGIFSFLFKKKKVNNVEESKNAVDNASSKDSIIKEGTKDHQDICDFLLCYENYQKFINQDNYISVKNTKDFYSTVSEKIQYLKKLNPSNLLKEMCTVTPYDRVIKYVNQLENINSSVEKHNDAFIENKKVELKQYLDDTLKECDPNILLDNDQRNCVLSDEDYSLVIAGAGAGKTTTVAAKIKYLVDIKKINPKDILVVSFTNKAVGELRYRVNKQLKIDCPITTFHSTGIAIIKKDSPEEKITPVNEGFLYNAIRDYLQGAIASDTALLNKMILLFASYFEAPFEEGDLKDFFSYVAKSDFSTLKSNLGEYNQQIIDNRTKKYYTIQDERVNSKQEVQIANFLYMNNIEYTYEPTYPFYIEGSDKYYTPDFFIKQGYCFIFFLLGQREA